MKKLLEYMKPHKFLFLSSIILLVFISLSTAYSPILESYVITSLSNSVTNNLPFAYSYVLTLTIILGLIFLTSTIFRLLVSFFLTDAIQKTTKKIRSDVQVKIHKVPIKFFDSTSIGDTMSKMANDAESLSNGLQQSFANLFGASFTIILILIIMFIFVSWIFAAITIIIIPIIFIITKFIIKKSSPYFTKRFNTYGILTGHLQEQYTGHKEITLFNKQKDSAKIFDDLMKDLSKYIFKSDFTSGLLIPIITIITYFLIVIIVIIGGNFVLNKTMDIGILHASVRYIWILLSPTIKVAQMSSVIQSAKAAANRLFSFLDEEEENDNGKLALKENLKGKVNFNNVNFFYSKNLPVLNNLTFSINPGETIAIVGPTGSGKTTIVNLLMRFYEIQSGEIFLDDINIRDMKKDYIREKLGMVLQDTWLFNGSIYENIKYGNDKANLDDVIKAAKAAKIHDYITSLPNSYDTLINQEASNISQGEKQLLTIARAFLANPNILILDEATSTVDTRLEQMLQVATNNIMKNRTSIVIAHRLSTIKNANKILVINNGNLIETGNHEDLLKKGGFYAKLYNSQFE